MNRIPILLLSFFFVASSGIALSGKDKMPNIILIMADDLGWGDVGFNGNQTVKTPSLDAMAAEGVVYNRFYAAAPICSPTRGSCLTGRHPYRYGILSAHTAGMRQGEITIAEIAKEKGYSTGIFGKWHLGFVHPSQQSSRGYYSPPVIHGFDEAFVTTSAVPTWNPTITPPGWTGWGQVAGTPWKGGEVYYHNGDLVTDNLDGDDSRVIMDRFIPFIRKAVQQQKPFLGCVWFHTPHSPVVAGPDYKAMYPGLSEKAKNYFGCITAMDEQIGRLNAELNRLSTHENTLIFFCSDNGPSDYWAGGGDPVASAGPYRGTKHTVYEGGVRVPAFFRWPARISQGQTTDKMASTVDYFPTIAEVIGYTFPDNLKRPIDGVSLLQAGKDSRPAPLFVGQMRLSQGSDTKALIENRFKLVHQSLGVWELYDLANDPFETENILEDHPELFYDMQHKLKASEDSLFHSNLGGDYLY